MKVTWLDKKHHQLAHVGQFTLRVYFDNDGWHGAVGSMPIFRDDACMSLARFENQEKARDAVEKVAAHRFLEALSALGFPALEDPLSTVDPVK